MRLNIKYFGSLVEITGCHEESIEFSKKLVSEMLAELFERYPVLKEIDFQVAQNNSIIQKESTIINAEIALLPPFSGG
jgi:molybdopterin synthase sulfur carrier subunit